MKGLLVEKTDSMTEEDDNGTNTNVVDREDVDDNNEDDVSKDNKYKNDNVVQEEEETMSRG
eukprot:766919-Ditylum_brightwellii.AAC.1